MASAYNNVLRQLWRDHTAPRSAPAPGVVSLFSGGGLSLLGYSAAGFRPLLAVDTDARALEVLELNFPTCPTWCGDVRDLTVDEVLRITGLQVGELDLLDASPPCECFSTLGDRKVEDARNLLPIEFARFVAGLRPRTFVMEQVPAFAGGRTKHLYERLVEELRQCGYVVEPKEQSSFDFQVPQKRKRLIVIGVRNDLGVPASHPATEAGR
jgi:DNA (cytosine-5)-methyltransferase 1